MALRLNIQKCILRKTDSFVMDIEIEKKKGIQRKHIYWAAGILVLIILIGFAFLSAQVSTYRVDKKRILTAKVEEGTFSDYITISGNLEPISTIYLDAREGGRVEKKVAEEGQMVQKGDTILLLSNPDLSLNILNSEAQLAEKSNFLRNTMVTMEQEKLRIKRELLNLKFDIKRKKRKFEQYKILMKDSLISVENYLQTEEDFEYAQKSYELYMERQMQDSIYRSIQIIQMESNLCNMQKNLELVRKRQDHLTVRAPIDGMLTVMDAEIGQSIPKGGRLGQIHVLTSYKVVAEIDEHYIDRVKTGFEALLERQGRDYLLRIRKVHPDVNKGKFKVELVFVGKQPENMRTGQTYYTRLKLGDSKKALLLPKGQFFKNTGGRWAFVLSKDEKYAEKKDIRLGNQNPVYYEVTDGLREGDKVIISDYESFGGNEKIIFK